MQIRFPLYKILNSNRVHYTHTYTVGENKLPDAFNPSGFGKSGGFYLPMRAEEWIMVGQDIAPVTLFDDTRVWVMPDCIKVDHLWLGEPEAISQATCIDWKKANAFCPLATQCKNNKTTVLNKRN